MPKHLSEVWDQYQVIGSSGNKKHVVCIHCNSEYRYSHATRMVQHIMKCKKCPIDIKNKYRSTKSPQVVSNENISPNTSTSQNSNDRMCPRPSTSFGSECENLNSVLSNESCLQSLDRTMQIVADESELTQKDEIDANIARAVFVSGAPLSLLESKYWKRALKSLNPEYEPPTRHCLSNRLLDAEYSRVKSDIENKIRASAAVAIITDGWTNINGKGVINFIVTVPEPLFFKSVYPECDRETADYLSSEIIKVIEEIGPAKIVAIITDNAKNMKAAWRLVQNKYPGIACIGCVAHALNLIYNDISKLPTLKNAVEQTTKIIKYVKNKHRALAYFEKIQSTLYGNLKQTLKLPCKTRWNSIVLSLESFDNNKEALKALAVAEEIDIGGDIITALLDEGMWSTIKSISKVLKPISEAITNIESDKARISDVPVTFIKLLASVEDELTVSIFQEHEQEVIRRAILKRKIFCIQPIQLAANLLDPRYMGSGLTSDEEADANNLIFDQAQSVGKNRAAVMTNVAEFRTKTGFFAKCHSAWITTETVSPQFWWQGFASKQTLCPIAYRLLSVPPSSAAAERNWSLFANTHSISRNRLQKERVNKLITVRQNLKYFDDVTEEDLISDCVAQPEHEEVLEVDFTEIEEENI